MGAVTCVACGDRFVAVVLTPSLGWLYFVPTLLVSADLSPQCQIDPGSVTRQCTRLYQPTSSSQRYWRRLFNIVPSQRDALRLKTRFTPGKMRIFGGTSIPDANFGRKACSLFQMAYHAAPAHYAQLKGQPTNVEMTKRKDYQPTFATNKVANLLPPPTKILVLKNGPSTNHLFLCQRRRMTRHRWTQYRQGRIVAETRTDCQS